MNAALCGLVLFAAIGANVSSADTRPEATPASSASEKRATPDRFTATTTGMTPSGVGLRIDVSRWSDDEGRAAVVAAMSSDDAAKELEKLPTVGFLWQSNSAAGYALKYAHRASTPQGQSVVTFVTARRLGFYDFKPWSIDAPAATQVPEYSVIELRLDEKGEGSGTLSLAAQPNVDEASSLVTLPADAPRVLASAKLEPKPYWAQ